MSGYNGTLKDGREIFVPSWPVDVALQNLAKAGQYLGTENIIRISEINIPAVIVAIAEASDASNAAGVIKHFICESVRIDGEKVNSSNYNSMFEGKLDLVAELFATVIHAQYHSFFESGLVKETSQDS
jgi:hypothetical protein